MQRINHRLRRFVGMSKLKKVALNVIAQKLTEAEIGHLRGVSPAFAWRRRRYRSYALQQCLGTPNTFSVRLWFLSPLRVVGVVFGEVECAQTL